MLVAWRLPLSDLAIEGQGFSSCFRPREFHRLFKGVLFQFRSQIFIFYDPLYLVFDSLNIIWISGQPTLSSDFWQVNNWKT